MHVDEYIHHVRDAEISLSMGLKKIIAQHAFETDVVEMCERFIRWSEQHLSALEEFESKAEDASGETGKTNLFKTLFSNIQMGPYGLLRDLHALSLLIHNAQTSWTILNQAAMAMRNTSLETVCKQAGLHLNKESMWIETRIKNAAPQILVAG
jgi:hypothetical protein